MNRVVLAERLAAAGVDNAEREAQWLLEEALDPAQPAGLDAMVTRREQGEPLQYVFGHWPFRSVDLLVDQRALIPRPETEMVVQAALDEFDAFAESKVTVVDLGTGTGAIALSIATEVPRARVWAVDASAEALALATENRDRLGLDQSRVGLCTGSWFDPLPASLRGAVDLIVSNPPYVATGDELDATVRDWEPAEALFAGADGLDALRVIIAESPRWLTPKGVLVCEIGATQGDAVVELAGNAGFGTAEVRPDPAGLDRILVARNRG